MSKREIHQGEGPLALLAYKSWVPLQKRGGRRALAHLFQLHTSEAAALFSSSVMFCSVAERSLQRSMITISISGERDTRFRETGLFHKTEAGRRCPRGGWDSGQTEEVMGVWSKGPAERGLVPRL